MKCPCSVVLWALLAIPKIACAPAVELRSPEAIAALETRDHIDYWTRENYHQALDSVFQDRCASPIDARWLSCVRIIPAFKDELECSLSLERRYDGTLLAKIVRPKGHSIRAQLYERKKEQPHSSVRDLAKLIEIESRTGDQRRFPGLADLADKFENLRLSPVLSDEIIMDPTEYRFHLRTASGESMELILNGPGPAAPHQSQTLIEWAESAREMLASAFH